MSLVLACDLGGTSFRAALVDEAGATLAQASVPAPVPNEQAGGSEIDPAAWWQALLETTGRIVSNEPELFARVAGIAVCGVTRTQVCLGVDGAPLRPAITWKDTRAEGAAARLRERLDDHPEAARINAFHPLARLAWLGEEEPANAAALTTVLEPKDWLNFRLTGRRAGDPVSMARLLAAAEPVSGIDALACIGLPATIVPPVVAPERAVGGVVPGLPAPFDRLAGVPVFCCANDTWAAVAGLGALRPGYAYNISGTTEVLGLVGAEPAEADGLLTVDWGGLWQLGGPSQNGADTVAWLLSVLGKETGEEVGPAMTELLAGERDPQPLLFLPYLQGERVPYWDPALRGAFIGLGRSHGATDLAWAVLEGVAFLNRIVLERAEAALGQPAGEIRFGGGGATNPVWSQIKADICGRPVVVGSAKEPGLLGAAITAWTGLGRFASLAQAQAELVSVSQRFEPDIARRAHYDALFALFRQAEAALGPVSAALVSLARASSSRATKA